ncbi:hypothetical protein C471_07591 [Halorubrum saccharovorum DSM 1137]|uniref:Uncharacterized protein n=1 Tax=Halorubrum saccharovorum DSM 1137 TaxID=1227484 RepID=M0E0R8_9EURY|nr:hypothetical protein [Halorubrum saccharovorum]ELZ40628.1 hypothetical protein C471_07591 [Halorubrum saccharovorum DSM 1137]
MFSSEPTLDMLPSFIVVVLISVFLISIGHRFIDTVSDKTTWTHFGGGFVSGLYLGYDVDPDAMILRELVDLTVILGSSFLSSVLSALNILFVFEILLGSFYIADKRGKAGVLGSVLVICSGYLLPGTTQVVGIGLFIAGSLAFMYSDESDF